MGKWRIIFWSIVRLHMLHGVRCLWCLGFNWVLLDNIASLLFGRQNWLGKTFFECMELGASEHDMVTLGFIYFVGLKMHQKPLVYAAQCQVPGWTPQNKSGPSKVTLPAEDTWLCAKIAPNTYYILMKNWCLNLAKTFAVMSFMFIKVTLPKWMHPLN